MRGSSDTHLPHAGHEVITDVDTPINGHFQVTRYSSGKVAEDALATIMVWREEDDRSSCKVEPHGRHFIIVFHDEDGVRIGPL